MVERGKLKMENTALSRPACMRTGRRLHGGKPEAWYLLKHADA